MMHKRFCYIPKNSKRQGNENVLSCEQPEDHKALLQALTEHYRPADNAERWLVQQLCHTYWRICRAQAVETGTYSLLLERMSSHFEAESVQPEQRLLKIWNAAQARSQVTSAYEARLWRIANQIRADLDRLVNSRSQTDPPRRPALAKTRRPAA